MSAIGTKRTKTEFGRDWLSAYDPKRTCLYKSNRQPTALGLGGRSYGVWSFLYGKSKIPTFT